MSRATTNLWDLAVVLALLVAGTVALVHGDWQVAVTDLGFALVLIKLSRIEARLRRR